MTPTVNAVMHTDVRGKTQYYLKVTANGKPDYIINVGEKTYQTVKDMENDGASQTPVDDNSTTNRRGNRGAA